MAVADLEGYVHWFDRATGALAGREKVGHERVSTPMLAIDGTLYVIDDKGDVNALRVVPITPRAAKAEPAPPATGGG